jgi:hypothetical protein
VTFQATTLPSTVPAAPSSPADREASAGGGAAAADWSRLFVCPTLTPLYYTPGYAALTDRQRLRYNQLTAVAFNDLVLFFEQTFAAALAALLADPSALDDDLRRRVERFAADERRHVEMWRRLNRMTAAGRGNGNNNDGDGQPLVRVGRPLAAALGWMAARPRAFPVVVLVMLLLEEHSIEIARRCGRMAAGDIEPHYAAAHRAHLADEARHVNVDRELLAKLLSPARGPLRRLNAVAFRAFVRRLWLRPTRAAARVVDALAGEFPDLRPARRRLVRELGQLADHPGYRRMMFSPQSTPLTFAALRAHPDFDPEPAAANRPHARPAAGGPR